MLPGAFRVNFNQTRILCYLVLIRPERSSSQLMFKEKKTSTEEPGGVVVFKSSQLREKDFFRKTKVSKR